MRCLLPALLLCVIGMPCAAAQKVVSRIAAWISPNPDITDR